MGCRSVPFSSPQRFGIDWISVGGRGRGQHRSDAVFRPYCDCLWVEKRPDCSYKETNQFALCGEQRPNDMTSACGPILVVDDDPASRELVSCLLEGIGCSTVETETGEAALVAAGEQRPELVLLDVRLPGISGYEVCRQLRERFGEQLPIIFVSGDRTEAHDRVAGLMIGADDYLSKPFVPDELVARVQRLLVRSEAGNGTKGGSGARATRLTEREQEVLQLLAEGLAQGAIAAEIGRASCRERV